VVPAVFLLEGHQIKVYDKVVLVYEKPFWDEGRDVFGLLRRSEAGESLNQDDYSARRGRLYLFWNCIKTSGRPMLSQYTLVVGEVNIH
jgi:hypothetical protein